MAAIEEALLVWTTMPDEKAAADLAQQLVKLRLAACVHVQATGNSFYMWEEALQKDAETTLLIKTRASLYQELESRIKELHPYDLPEIIATPVVKGETGYLQWLAQSTKQPD